MTTAVQKRREEEWWIGSQILGQQVKPLTEILGKKKRNDEDEDCLVLGNLKPVRKVSISL